MPAFPLSVPESVWIAVAEVTSNGFADSYLYGAHPSGGILEPRTVIAYDAMRRDKHVVDALKAQGFVLAKPAPWRDGNGKPTAADAFGTQHSSHRAAKARRTRGDFDERV